MNAFADIVVDGRDAVLCLVDADWTLRPKLALLMAVDEAEAGTGIEARAAEHHDERLTQTVRVALEESEAQAFLAKLLALSNQRIAIPIAADIRTAAEYVAGTRIFSAQHRVNWNRDSGAYAIDADAPHAETCGLLIGTLASEPEIIARTDLHAVVELQIEDDSPWASRVEINTTAAPAWVWVPEWTNEPRIGRHTQFKKEKVGRGREQAFLHKEAAIKREDRATFVLDGLAEIRAFLSFWKAHRGPHQSFTVPAWFHPGFAGDGDEPVLHVRFADEVLALEFIAPDVVRVSARFREELQLGVGQSSQARPSRAHLVKIWWEGSATVYKWSDWGRPLTSGGLTYEADRCEVLRASETLRPGESQWEIAMFDFDGNPLRAFALLQLERRMMIEIRECDPENEAVATLIFSGTIKTAPRRGDAFRAKCALIGDVFRHLVPNFFCQAPCNYTIYDDLCGVDEAAHKVLGVVAAEGDVTIDVNAGGDKAADYFAYGFAVIGAGDTQEIRFILRSEPIAGGTRLTVHRPLFYNAAGAAAEFYPGCDGQFEGGCVKFANQDNFGGAPHRPDYIESVETGFKPKTGK